MVATVIVARSCHRWSVECSFCNKTWLGFFLSARLADLFLEGHQRNWHTSPSVEEWV